MADIKPRKKSTKKDDRLFDPKLDTDAYNLVARHSKLSAIQLLSSHFDVYPGYFVSIDELKHDLCHKVVSLSTYKNQDVVAGIFRYEIISKKSRKHLSCIRADFMTLYDLPEGYAENEARAFCARVGLFAAYPYFRALYAHLSSAGNLEMPTLPVLSTDPLKAPQGKQSTGRARKRRTTKE